jgi:hypothetical protein
MNEERQLETIQSLVTEIKALHPDVVRLVDALTIAMRGISETDFPSAIDYYCELIGISAYREALVKCRILLEQNLVAIETLGALSLTRYVFELLVWLRTLEMTRNRRSSSTLR